MKKILLPILFLFISAQPLSVTAQGWSMFGDLLVWHASEESSAYWSSIISEPNNYVFDFDPSNFYFDNSLGFRGGFSYEADSSFWDTKLYWTFFPSKSTTDIYNASAIITPEFFSGFLSKNFFFAASIKWQLYMNMIDLEASHQFNITDSLTIRPAIGIKGGWINQSINADWNADIYTASEEVTNDFAGIGPSFGIEGKWNIFKKLGLVSNISTAFMWGNWNIKDTYSRPEAFFGLISPTTITTNMDDSLGTLMLDYFLGLEYVHQGRSHITFKLGYEMQYWANQLRMPTFQQLPVRGDLTLEGGTCRIYIDL